MLARKTGRGLADALPRCRTAKEPRQTQMRTAFIDEFEVCGDVAQGLLGFGVMGGAEGLDPRRFALTVVQGLFFAVSSS